jgi:hypothetical protein
MQYVAIAASVMSAAGSIQQGKSQQDMYKTQAEQARLKASQDALASERAANQAFEKLIMVNANASARAYAGGVQGLDGSAKLIQVVNKRKAGEDIQDFKQNADSAIKFGESQAAIFKAAGSAARTSSYYDAITSIGTAAFMYGKVAPLSGSGTSGFQTTGFWKGAA